MAVPIKIAIVLRPASGGMARHVETLLAALNASRVEFVIFAPASTRLHLHNIRRVDLEIPAAVSPIRDLKAIAALRRRLEADSIRLVHAHGLRTLWICASAARGQGLPLLFTAHNVPRVSLMSRLILKRAISAGFRAIAVSNAVADRLRLLGVPHGFISVIPNGINLSEFTALPPVHAVRESWKLAQNDLVIAGVGRLSEEKGFQILLEAAARLFGRFPHLRLLIAGDGPMAPQLRERARELEDSAGTQRIRFCGQISNVAGLLAA
ncbi:MAG TPA: glycosyltransferase, partial [Chthonomonadales bacterium]|nr:glycosyltransferase [Chthonomonadales bacterium]